MPSMGCAMVEAGSERAHGGDHPAPPLLRTSAPPPSSFEPVQPQQGLQAGTADRPARGGAGVYII
eukprot:4395160-Pleurochrysis_carterae.AAC.1